MDHLRRHIREVEAGNGGRKSIPLRRCYNTLLLHAGEAGPIDLAEFNRTILDMTEMKSASRTDKLKGMLAKKHDGWFSIIKVIHNDGSNQESVFLAEMMSKNGFLSIAGDAKSGARRRDENIYFVGFDILIYRGIRLENHRIPYKARMKILKMLCDGSDDLFIAEQRSRKRRGGNRDKEKGNTDQTPHMKGFRMCGDKLRYVHMQSVSSGSEAWRLADLWSQEEGVEGAVLTHPGFPIRRTKLKPVYDAEIVVVGVNRNKQGQITSAYGPRVDRPTDGNVTVKGVPADIEVGAVITYQTNYATAQKRAGHYKPDSARFFRPRADGAFADEAREIMQRQAPATPTKKRRAAPTPSTVGSSSSSSSSSGSSKRKKMGSSDDSSSSDSRPDFVEIPMDSYFDLTNDVDDEAETEVDTDDEDVVITPPPWAKQKAPTRPKPKPKPKPEPAKAAASPRKRSSKGPTDPLAERDLPLMAAYLECVASGKLKEACIRSEEMRRLHDWVESKRSSMPYNLAPTGTQMFLELPDRGDGTPLGNSRADLKQKLLAGKKLHIKGGYVIKLGRGTSRRMNVETAAYRKKYGTRGGWSIPNLSCSCGSFTYGNSPVTKTMRDKSHSLMRDPKATATTPDWLRVCKHIIQIMSGDTSIIEDLSDVKEGEFTAADNRAMFMRYIRCLREGDDVTTCFATPDERAHGRKILQKLSGKFQTALQIIFSLPRDDEYRLHLETGGEVRATGSDGKTTYTMSLSADMVPTCTCLSFSPVDEEGRAPKRGAGNFATRKIRSNDPVHKLPFATGTEDLPNELRVCKHWQMIANPRVRALQPVELMFPRALN